jgi:acetylornithine deacetylase/succinyl-diaminopimelate desuccinylase family protein
MTNRSDEIARVLDAERTEMRDLLSALVAIPTENPPATGYRQCVAFLEATLTRLGVPFERLEIPSPAEAPRAALRAWIGEGGPALCFHGHFDVVPAAAEGQFVPRIEGDTLFGRGSSDMKSGLVAMLFAARSLRTAGVALRGRLELLFVPDEETGGAFGTAALAAAGALPDDAVGMLLPEPTSGVVWNGNRGAITLEVTVRGRAAHVALQHQGTNAVERALPLLARLFEFKRELDARNGSILLVGGRVDAGKNFNLVPDECRFTLDRRTDPGEDFDAEKQRLMAILEAALAEGLDLEVRTIQEGRSASTPTDGPLAAALSSAVAAVTGEPPAFESCPGLLETRFYAARGVPALAYGPGILAVSHGPHEFVKISRMVECARIYALTAAWMLAGEPN